LRVLMLLSACAYKKKGCKPRGDGRVASGTRGWCAAPRKRAAPVRTSVCARLGEGRI